MQTTVENLPTETDKLHNLLQKSYTENKMFSTEIQEIRIENESLKYELANLKRMIFGQKSERFIEADPNQLVIEGLFGSTPIEEEKTQETITYDRKKPKKKGHSRQPLPDHLLRIKHEIEPSEDDKICGCCNKERTVIGEDITEELEYKPAKLYVNQFVRKKYACTTCKDTIITGELPPRPIEKGRPGNGLVTHIVVSKFVDHLPFYRLEQIFKRDGVFINRSTMSDWIREFYRLFTPLYTAMSNMVSESSCIQADETHVKVQDPKLSGKTHNGYFWSYLGDKKLVVFDYQDNRGRNGPVTFLDGFEGYLQTDGYAGYNEHVRRNDVTHLACWAHARRKFFDAKDKAPKCEMFLTLIKNLYKVESDAKEQKLSYDEIHELRKERSAPILKEIKELLDNPPGTVLPGSPMGKAIYYTLNLWKKLNVYLEDGSLEIDNNGCERTIRAIAIGRKNWMFAGSHEGAKRAALIYSLVATCKLNDINPFEYIKDVLIRIRDYPQLKIRDLVPTNWKKNRESENIEN